MYRVSLMTLIFSFLVLLATSCAPGPQPNSCANGQVVDTRTGQCIDNSCVNFNCGPNESCTVDSIDGPSCTCNNGYLEINTANGMSCQKNPCLNSNYDVCNGASCTPVKRNGRYIPICGKNNHNQCPEGQLPVNVGSTHRCVDDPCLTGVCGDKACTPQKRGNNYIPLCAK